MRQFIQQGKSAPLEVAEEIVGNHRALAVGDDEELAGFIRTDFAVG